MLISVRSCMGAIIRVAFAALFQQLVIVSVACGQVRVDSITSFGDVGSEYPSWLPDGSRVVFHWDRAGNADLYLRDIDGKGGWTRLTNAPAADLTPVWTPGGAHIVFQSDRDGNRDIYIMTSDGSDVRNLTRHPAEDSHPKVTADGRIIFDSDREQPGRNYEVYEMHLDGSAVRRLTSHPDLDTYGSWSPDGRRLAWRRVVSQGRSRNSEVFVKGNDDAQPTNLTNHDAYDGWPAWSPDGRRIAFASDRDEPRRWQIYVMDADGRNLVRLTPDDEHGGYYTRPAWSPDGSKIVCNRTRGDSVAMVILHLRITGEERPIHFTRVAAGTMTEDGGLSRGVAWGDFDNDGDPDLAVANTIGQSEFLYRNDGSSGFTAIREGWAVRSAGWSEGVNWADYDNDGDLDLLVTNTHSEVHSLTNDVRREPLFLFANDGKGSLVPTHAGALTRDTLNVSAACWADYDLDGDLDVYVVNRGGMDDRFYVNEGRGEFTAATNTIIQYAGGDGRSCAWGDADGDGYPDLVVANFSRENEFFYRNHRNGKLTRVLSGDLVESRGATYGVSWADYDDDGDADILLTNIFLRDQNLLFENDGTGAFRRARIDAFAADSGAASKGHAWGDFDHDGDLDLFIANGTERPDVWNFLYVNHGAGKFAGLLEPPFTVDADTAAGAALADYDRDGDLDLFVANWGGGAEDNALYRNDTAAGSWISIRLVGKQSNRFGIGAVARVTGMIDGRRRTLTRWLFPETGYASQSAGELHFGLGNATQVDLLEIRWPSGIVDQLEKFSVNRFLTVTEGSAARSGVPTSPDSIIVSRQLWSGLLAADSCRSLGIVMPRDGWHLSVEPDGSGHVTYAALPQSARVPPGTFDFRNLYAGLIARALAAPSDERTGTIECRGDKGAQVALAYLDDESFAAEQFEHAWTHVSLPPYRVMRERIEMLRSMWDERDSPRKR